MISIIEDRTVVVDWRYLLSMIICPVGGGDWCGDGSYLKHFPKQIIDWNEGAFMLKR